MRRFAGLFVLCCLFLCAAGHGLADRLIVMTFLGDCTIGCVESIRSASHGFFKIAEREGYGYFFRNVQPLLAGDDLTVANFEGVLKDDAKDKVKKEFNFRGLPAYAQILTMGSVEAVSLENNHAGDYGPDGKRSTQEALEAEGIAYFDSETIHVFEKDDVRIALIGVYQWSGEKYMDGIAASVAGAKEAGANAVVAYMHAGGEYSAYHIQAQTDLAHRLIDAGADLVVGSHPHVVQGAEVYKGRLILYSLGNFVFGGNTGVRALETIVPRVAFSFADDGTYLGLSLFLYPAHVSGDAVVNDYQPRIVQGEAAKAVFRRFDRDGAQADGLVIKAQTESCRQYRLIPAAGY